MDFFEVSTDKKTPDSRYHDFAVDSKYASVKAHIEELWRSFNSPKLNPDGTAFLNNAKQNLEGACWQMFLTMMLSNEGFQLLNASDLGPDIRFSESGRQIAVEAIAATNGAGVNAVYDPPLKIDEIDIGSGDATTFPAKLLRISEAFQNKAKQYHRWMQHPDNAKAAIISKNDPYIIAISGGGIHHCRLPASMPSYAARFLFACAEEVVEILVDIKTGNPIEILGSGLNQKENIPKKNTPNTVKAGPFTTAEFSYVSAVLFTPDSVYHRVTAPSQSRLELILNPFATNPITPANFSKKVTHILTAKNKTSIEILETATNKRMVHDIL